MIFYVMDSVILKGVLKNYVFGREWFIIRNMVCVELVCENNKVKLMV